MLDYFFLMYVFTRPSLNCSLLNPVTWLLSWDLQSSCGLFLCSLKWTPCSWSCIFLLIIFLSFSWHAYAKGFQIESMGNSMNKFYVSANMALTPDCPLGLESRPEIVFLPLCYYFSSSLQFGFWCFCSMFLSDVTQVCNFGHSYSFVVCRIISIIIIFSKHPTGGYSSVFTPR